MSRSFEWLQDQEQPPYWIELAVTDEQITRIEASNGTILEQEDDFERILDLDLRVGDWTLDNTHPIIDGGYFSDDPTHLMVIYHWVTIQMYWRMKFGNKWMWPIKQVFDG